jgi:hypothetical protein
MNLVILFPKERSILYLKMNILFLIMEVCDRIKPSSAPQKKGRLTLKTDYKSNAENLTLKNATSLIKKEH